MQEIQEALDERHNQLDSLLVQNQVDHSLAQPFAFESQIDPDLNPVDLSLKSSNESLQRSLELDRPSSKESVPLLNAPNEKTSPRQRKPHWTTNEIKTEMESPV